jgi:hypothetical protein
METAELVDTYTALSSKIRHERLSVVMDPVPGWLVADE